MGVAIAAIEKLLKEAEEAEELARAGCETCRWWDDGHICDKTRSASGVALHEQTKAVAHNVEGYSAWLATAPDFYCSMWEKKGDKDG